MNDNTISKVERAKVITQIYELHGSAQEILSKVKDKNLGLILLGELEEISGKILRTITHL